MRAKAYIETDCLTEARKRLHHVFDTFDSVAVCFSGGKDSLVALHLTHEIAKERGINRINVIFRDEELIPDEVLDFVNEYRQKDWVDMRWYAVPLTSTKYVLGICKDYVQWDPVRQWVRPPPPWSIRLAPGDTRIFDQFNTDDFIADNAGLKGRVAFVTGIRASESVMRFRACVNKLHENYINASGSNRVWLVKPIFDWEENDVFKFFQTEQVKYCPLYDQQLYAGMQLRVSTPLHAEYAKRFDKLKHVSPVFYEQVISVFPEMLVQGRYYKDIDRQAIIKQYGQSMDGVRAWIVDNIQDEHKLRLAFERFRSVEKRAKKMPGSYPAAYILKQFMSGGFKREILPFKKAVK